MSLKPIKDILNHPNQDLESEGGTPPKRSTGSRVSKVNQQAAKVPSSAWESRLEKLRQRTLKGEVQKNTAIEARILQESFDFWNDDHRGVPNPFIRSGLFSVKNTTKRDFVEKSTIESLSNYEINYTGQELQQDDLTVWMALINMVRNRPMSDMVIFTGYQLIKDIGWRMHSESYAKAKASIERLKVTGLSIVTKDESQGYSGSLIREFAWDYKENEGATKWMVRFEPKVSMLFMQDTTSFIEWEQRKKIGVKNTVALWLHSFYTSHREPLPYSVAKFHELTKSGSPLSSFRRAMSTSLAKLQKIGFLESFEIINDHVHVKKARLVAIAVSPSASGSVKKIGRKAA